MTESHSTDWNKDTIRALRLRLGWCRYDMARRLQCSSADIESWEEGMRDIEVSFVGQLELLLRQAEACSDEVKYMPAAEKQCETNAYEQIDFSRVKADLE